MHKILFWLFFAKIKMATCVPETNKSGFTKGKKLYDITKVGNLPNIINESSGLAKIKNKSTFYTHNDGGGKAELYEIDNSGNLITTLQIPNITNIDWEDLAYDKLGNIYIGDFGNNTNQRKDLTIYKFQPNNSEKIEKITFRFSDQKEFPPQKKDMNFDCEAFFWANDSLFLFSKNRGEKSVKMYKIPSLSGDYIAEPAANIFLKTNITSADISPSGNQFALLSYGKIFLFGVENNQISFSKPQFCIKASLKQSEALSYIAENEILITNEQKEVFVVKLNYKIRD